MDGVRLTAPTVLMTSPQPSKASSSTAALPSGVVLVVARGGREIVYRFPVGEGGDSSAATALIHGFEPAVLADLCMTKPSLHGQLLDISIGDVRLVGWPASLNLVPLVRPSPDVFPDFKWPGEQQEPKPNAARAISVVFVLPSMPAPGAEERYSRALAATKNASQSLADALCREEATGELVTRYLAEHAAAQNPAAAAAAAAAAAPPPPPPPLTPAGLEGDEEWKAATREALEVWEAASTFPPDPVKRTGVDTVLREALLALQAGRPRVLRVGTFTDVGVCEPEQPPAAPRLAANPRGMPPPPPLRPYLALLPLEEPRDILAELPSDASAQLVRLVRVASPLRSLEQLANDTGLDLSHVLTLARHLQHWRKVRMIAPLTGDAVLCVHPDASLTPSPAFVARFGLGECARRALTVKPPSDHVTTSLPTFSLGTSGCCTSRSVTTSVNHICNHIQVRAAARPLLQRAALRRRAARGRGARDAEAPPGAGVWPPFTRRAAVCLPCAHRAPTTRSSLSSCCAPTRCASSTPTSTASASPPRRCAPGPPKRRARRGRARRARRAGSGRRRSATSTRRGGDYSSGCGRCSTASITSRRSAGKSGWGAMRWTT